MLPDASCSAPSQNLWLCAAAQTDSRQDKEAFWPFDGIPLALLEVCVCVCASQECVPPCSKLKHAMQNSHTVVLHKHFKKLLFSQSLLCHFHRVSSHNDSNSGLQTKSIWAHRICMNMLQSQKATAPALCFRRSKEEDGQLPSADKALEIHFDRAELDPRYSGKCRRKRAARIELPSEMRSAQHLRTQLFYLSIRSIHH